MRRGIVRHDQHRRLAGTDEVARHPLHEVGPDAVEVVQVLLDYRHVQGRRANSSGAQTSRPELYMASGFSGRCPTG